MPPAVLPPRFPPAPISLRTAILRHELPDGSNHLDWLLAMDSQAQQPLLSFRAFSGPDQLIPGQAMELQQIADHRPVYLDYEGPVGGDRGRVTALRRGQIAILASFTGRIEFRVDWDTAPQSSDGMVWQRLRLEHRELDFWQVTCIDAGR